MYEGKRGEAVGFKIEKRDRETRKIIIFKLDTRSFFLV